MIMFILLPAGLLLPEAMRTKITLSGSQAASELVACCSKGGLDACCRDVSRSPE